MPPCSIKSLTGKLGHPLTKSGQRDDLVRQGKVRHVGYSNFSAWKAAKKVGIQTHHNYAPFVTARMYCSLLGRNLEHEVVPFVEGAGIGVLV